MADEAATDSIELRQAQASTEADARPTEGPDALTERVAKEFSGRLRVFAARRLRGDLAAAEDVVQDTLKTILEALRAGRMREPRAIAAFAFETAKNHCMHRERSRGREFKAAERLTLSPPVVPPDVLTTVISEERARAVSDAINSLSEEDRRLLEMTYMEGRTSPDIGRVLGVAPNAVRGRRHRALARLRALLGITRASDREQEE